MGTGLGLSQVFGYVRQSGGHVKIYSELGEGTTVKMYLPRYTGAVAAVDAPSPAETMPQAHIGETVLVVEDDPRVRELAMATLAELGYEVCEAGDATAALALLATGRPVSLLFTDIVMPGMNGRRLAELATELRPGLPVLYTTGYTRNAIVHHGRVDHGIAFVSKPYSIAQLARKVREVLDSVAEPRRARRAPRIKS